MRWARAVVEAAGELSGGVFGAARRRDRAELKAIYLHDVSWRSSGWAQLHSPTWLPSGSVKTANRP
jgi:hypothetical protein